MQIDTRISPGQLADNRIFHEHLTMVKAAANIVISEGWAADF